MKKWRLVLTTDDGNDYVSYPEGDDFLAVLRKSIMAMEDDPDKAIVEEIKRAFVGLSLIEWNGPPAG